MMESGQTKGKKGTVTIDRRQVFLGGNGGVWKGWYNGDQLLRWILKFTAKVLKQYTLVLVTAEDSNLILGQHYVGTDGCMGLYGSVAVSGGLADVGADAGAGAGAGATESFVVTFL